MCGIDTVVISLSALFGNMANSNMRCQILKSRQIEDIQFYLLNQWVGIVSFANIFVSCDYCFHVATMTSLLKPSINFIFGAEIVKCFIISSIRKSKNVSDILC